jgi:hypothetical protein
VGWEIPAFLQLRVLLPLNERECPPRHCASLRHGVFWSGSLRASYTTLWCTCWVSLVTSSRWGSCDPSWQWKVPLSIWGKVSSVLLLLGVLRIPVRTYCNSALLVWTLQSSMLLGADAGMLSAPLLHLRRVWLLPHTLMHPFGHRRFCWNMAVKGWVSSPFCYEGFQKPSARPLPSTTLWLVSWGLAVVVQVGSTLWWSANSIWWILGIFELLWCFVVRPSL